MNRTIPPQWGPLRLRPLICTYAPRGCIVRPIRLRPLICTCAPRGCIVRVDGLAKSRNARTRKILPLLCARRPVVVPELHERGVLLRRAARPRVLLPGLQPAPHVHQRRPGPCRCEPANTNSTPMRVSSVSSAHLHARTPHGGPHAVRAVERTKPLKTNAHPESILPLCVVARPT